MELLNLGIPTFGQLIVFPCVYKLRMVERFIEVIIFLNEIDETFLTLQKNLYNN